MSSEQNEIAKVHQEHKHLGDLRDPFSFLDCRRSR